MTVEKVKTNLPQDPYGMENVWMDLYNCMISPEDFIAKFDGAELTFDSLYNHPSASTGWKKQFEAWKDQDILT
jgi:hypothetical protein